VTGRLFNEDGEDISCWWSVERVVVAGLLLLVGLSVDRVTGRCFFFRGEEDCCWFRFEVTGRLLLVVPGDSSSGLSDDRVTGRRGDTTELLFTGEGGSGSFREGVVDCLVTTGRTTTSGSALGLDWFSLRTSAVFGVVALVVAVSLSDALLRVL